MYYIYALRDMNGDIKYIGQTQKIEVRKRDHKRQKPQHTFEILFENLSINEAKKIEIENIDKYNTYRNGWNKTTGGEGFSGYERDGVGGVKKGNIPWNKGKPGCFSEETIEKFKKTRSGRVFSRKLNDEEIKEIRSLYKTKPHIDGVGDIMKNGKKMSYIQAFCKKYSEEYNITLQGLKRVVLEECWQNV
ncbi:GIY-YIG nuclease family protein [Vulcanococcus sp.]|uniref:GIY-YIG nuclease family protein n=1 Tax=Vulcanococcus sp. TaxID=2856995 RepID=UPI003F696C61